MYSYIKWDESFKIIFFDFHNFIVLKVNHSGIKWNIAWDRGQTWEINKHVAYMLYAKDEIADMIEMCFFLKFIVTIK